MDFKIKKLNSQSPTLALTTIEIVSRSNSLVNRIEQALDRCVGVTLKRMPAHSYDYHNNIYNFPIFVMSIIITIILSIKIVANLYIH